MRGKRVSPDNRKVDVVVVAARYAPQGGVLDRVKAYQRRGLVWGDVTLLGREELVQRLRRGLRVVTGRPKDLPGDFEIIAPVRLASANGTEALVAGGSSPGSGDDLDIPLF